MQWIGGHGSPRKAFEGLVEGATVHAISDGTWSLTDGLCEILRIVGKCDLAVSTWTAAQADLKRAERLLISREVKSLRLMVDRSFQNPPARLLRPGAVAVRRRCDQGLVEPCEICGLFRWFLRCPVPHERKHESKQAARKSYGRRRRRAPGAISRHGRRTV